MNIKVKKKYRSKRFIFVYSLIVISFITLIIALSFNPQDEREIGFEYLNSSGSVVGEVDGSVIHIWNKQDDYYFNTSSGLQFTNNFEEYWTHNVLCGGYKDNQEDWHYDCNDILPFDSTIETDNETYVNYTFTRDKNIFGRTARLSLAYHLKTNDKNLSIEVGVENLEKQSINYDLGFKWIVNDIQVRNNTENDKIKINDTHYNLNNITSLNFTNLDNPNYKIYDRHDLDEAFIKFGWDSSLNYILSIENTSGQYNAPVVLTINFGTLTPNEKKSTVFFWQDPLASGYCVDDHTCYEQGSPDPSCTCSQVNLNDGDFFGSASKGLQTKSGAIASGVVNMSNASLIPEGDSVLDANLTLNYLLDPSIDVCYFMYSTDHLASWNTIIGDCTANTTEVTTVTNLSSLSTSEIENLMINFTAIENGGGAADGIMVDYIWLDVVYGDITPPTIDFVNPTPDNASLIEDYNDIYVDITSDDAYTHYTFLDWVETLYAWYRLDNDTSVGEGGTLVYDWASRNKYNGTLGGDVWEDTGVYGSGYRIEAASDYIQIGTNQDFQDVCDNGCTFAAWVYFDDLNADNAIISRFDTTSDDRFFSLYRNDITTNFNFFIWEDGDTGNECDADSITVPSATTWYHVVGVYNLTNISIYVNGLDDTDASSDSDCSDFTINPLGWDDDQDTFLGIDNADDNTDELDGQIDEVLIFNRSLSPEEISSLYNATANQYYHNFTNLSNGDYKFTGYTVDINGNMNQTDERFITINITPPSFPGIEFVPPTPDNASTIGTLNFTVNISSSNIDSTHYTFVDFDETLYAWYRFDNDTTVGEGGSLVYDWSSRNLYNGTINGEVYKDDGVYGGSYRMEDTSDYIQVGTNTDFSDVCDNGCTFAAWVYIDNVNTDSVVFSRHDDANDDRFILLRRGSTDDRFIFAIWGDGSSSEICYVRTGVQPGGSTWYHVAGVYDINNVSIYLDGEYTIGGTSDPDCSDITINSTAWDDDQDTFIGIENSVDLAGELDGQIDELLIFNRSLTEVEIKSLYNATANQYSNNFTDLVDGPYEFTGYAITGNGLLNQTNPRFVTILTDASNDFFVNVSQRFSSIDQPLRDQYLFKNLFQNIIIASILDRTSILFKEVNLPISVYSLTNTVKGFIKEVYQPMNIYAVIDRSVSLMRDITQKNIIYSILERTTFFNRDISQLTTVNSLASRINLFIVDVSQLMTINSLTDRLSFFFVSITQSLLITPLIARIGSFFISLNQPINIFDASNGSYVNLVNVYGENITQGISIRDIEDENYLGNRNLDQLFTITALTSRSYNGFREITQAFTINSLVSKTREIFLDIEQQINIYSVVNRLISVVRYPIGFIIISYNAIADSVGKTTIDITQPIKITSITERAYNGFRETTQGLTITSIIAKSREAFSNVVESFKGSSIVDKIMNIIRRPSQSIVVNKDIDITTTNPSIDLDLIIPADISSNVEVSQYDFFQIAVNVTCRGATCGDINVSFDPQPIRKESTQSTDTTCNGNTCTKTLYSGIRNVYEDGQWKRVEDARSLKNKGYNEIYLEDDNIHDIEIIDFNYTFIEFALDYDRDNIAGSEYEYELVDNKLKTKFKIIEFNETGSEIEIEYEIEIEDNALTQVLDINPLGKRFKIGNDSTTIKLDEPNTEVLEDNFYAYHTSGAVNDSNYGSSTTLRAGGIIGIDSNVYHPIIKFNIEFLNESHDVSDAVFYFNVTSEVLEGDDILHFWEISNITWLETQGTLNDPIEPEGRYPDIYAGNVTLLNGVSSIRYGAEVTNAVDGNIANGNITFFGNLTDSYVIIGSKENSDVTARPYLNVTYSNTLKTGLISEVIGDTPFYTNESNPRNISLLKDESELVTAWVNATGLLWTNNTFYVYVNLTSDDTISNITQKWNVTIVQPSDTFSSNISQAIQTTSLFNRFTGLNRESTDNLLSYSTIDRLLYLTREIDGILTTTSLVGRSQLLFKEVINSILIVSSIDDFTGRILEISQQIKSSAITERTLLLFRIPIGFILITTNAVRDFIGVNSVEVSQAFQIDAISDRFYEGFRDNYESLTINTLTEKSRVALAKVYQSLQIDTLVDLSSVVFRNIFQRIIAYGEIISDQVGINSVAVSQLLNINALEDRTALITKDQTQKILVYTFTEKSRIAFADVVQLMTIDSIIDRTQYLFKISIQAIRAFTTSEATIKGRTTRLISESFSILTLLDRDAYMTKDITQPFIVNSVSYRFSGVVQSLTDSMNINTLIDRTTYLVRTPIQLIKFYSNVLIESRILYTREIFQSFTISDFVDRDALLSRSISDNLTIFDVFSSTRGLLVEVQQKFKSATAVVREADIVRNVVDVINYLEGLLTPSPEPPPPTYVDSVVPNEDTIPYVRLNQTLIFN